MDRSVKSPSVSSGEYHELAGAATIAVGVPSLVELAGLSVWAAPMYGGPKQDVPLTNPVGLGWHLLATHDLAWTGQATGAAATLVGGGIAAIAATAVGVRWACRRCRVARDERRNRKGRPAHMALGRMADRKPVDDRARYMGRGAELDDLCWAAVEAKAISLGVPLAAGQVPGVLIGRAVADGRELFGSFEDLHLDIWGPRQGKSTSRVIPAIMDAPGAVVATSNKRDVVDATYDHRASAGEVWVFDPQRIAGAEPSWYWDPCAWVVSDPELAQIRAEELAGHFADSTESTGGDAFFEPEGEDLLAGLILAAALAKKPITQAYEWITKKTDKSAVKILDQHDYPMVAASIAEQFNAPEKQKAGVFATAKKMASILKNQALHKWVCPPVQGERPRQALDLARFVRSTDTLYLLSKEGRGSGGALVTALAAAVAEEASALGDASPGGRVPVPLVIVLDEAANIVRWRDLPKQYSHFGSRGIVVMTILQSWAQGQRCWGAEGMDAMWGAANIKVLGSGLDDAGFLRDRSDMVGAHYELATSVSRGRKSDSATESTSRTTETTLTASEIGALPRGRCLVFSAGHRPTLVRTVPWMERGDAEVIRASIKAHTPTAIAPAGPRLRAVPTSEEDAA